MAPLVGLNYKITDNLFAYATLSTAFISGGGVAGIDLTIGF
jgi:outer membrane receptor protein involved in Fe transport